MQTQTYRILPRQPYSFDQTLHFVCGFTPMAGEQRVAERRLTKALQVDGAVVADIVAGPDGALDVALTAERLDDQRCAAALARVDWMLSLDQDLAPFYAIAAEDRALAPIARRFHGLHHPKFPSPFEITAWAVLVQRMGIRPALKVKRALVDRFGDRLEVGGEQYGAFPSAQRVAELSAATLQQVVPSAVKAEAIVKVARAYAEVDESWLVRAPYADVEAWLLDLPRIGAWSASFVLYRGLGRMERLDLAHHDKIAARARAVYGPGADLEGVFARYGEHLGTLCLYLRASGN